MAKSPLRTRFDSLNSAFTFSHSGAKERFHVTFAKCDA